MEEQVDSVGVAIAREGWGGSSQVPFLLAERAR